MPAIADPQLARLVIVWSPHRREASSGFLVAPDRVLTALHGIRRDDEQFEDCQVTALGENGSRRTTVQARVLWPPTGDREAAKHAVAVLELAESLSVDGEYEVKLAGGPPL
jgi:V8-like Glu-specific endopeptidase